MSHEVYDWDDRVAFVRCGDDKMKLLAVYFGAGNEQVCKYCGKTVRAECEVTVCEVDT